MGSIPVLGRHTGGGNDNPLHYSCLENSMDRGAWWATVHGGHKRVGQDWVTEHKCVFLKIIWYTGTYKGPIIVWFHLYEMFRIGKFIETKSRSVVASGWESGEARGKWVNATGYRGFLWGDKKCPKIDCGDIQYLCPCLYFKHFL